MSGADLLNELFCKALRDLPAGLCFAVTHAAARDHATVHAAGREAARSALKKAGYEGFAELTANEHGAPEWPVGWLGSISHSKGLCVAVVAEQSQFSCLGVDLEHLGRMRYHTVSRIATEAELTNLPESEVPRQGTILFSLKEAFYKAQHPHYQTSPRFHDLQLQWSTDESRATIIGLSGVIEKELQAFCQHAIFHAWSDSDRVLAICCARKH